MKCPGCEIELEENDLKLQVWHMERCHPELILKRWVDGGLYREEIQKLKHDMDSRLPSWERLVKFCTECGWTIEFQNEKEGVWGNFITLRHSKEGPDMNFVEDVVETVGDTAVSALCLAMDIANFRHPVQFYYEQ